MKPSEGEEDILRRKLLEGEQEGLYVSPPPLPPAASSGRSSVSMDVVKTKPGGRVRLEEALEVVGHGVYTYYVIWVTGLLLFSGFCNLQMMSVVIPIATCDLDLTSVQKGILASVAFSGITLSSHLFGCLADLLGRRKILLCCTLTVAIVSLISSLSPNYIILAICWFIVGFMTGGIFTPAYVLYTEFCPKYIRSKGMLIASALSSTATAYLACTAWLIIPLQIRLSITESLVFTSWRLFIALFPLTSLFPFILLYLLPETPKFVLNKGKEEETIHILTTIYTVNNWNTKKEYPVQSVCLDYDDEMTQQAKNGRVDSLLEVLKEVINQAILLFSPRFIWYTAAFSSMMVGVIGMYNAFVLWLPQTSKLLMLHSHNQTTFNSTICEVISQQKKTENVVGSCDLHFDSFLPNMIIGLCQGIAFLVISSFADKVNKKFIIVTTTSIPAVAAFVLVYLRELLLIITAYGVVIVLLLTVYPITLSIAVECFPTTLRSTATSVIMLFGRLSAAIGSQVFGYLFNHHCIIGYWSTSAVLIGVVIICILSPTKRKEPDEKTDR